MQLFRAMALAYALLACAGPLSAQQSVDYASVSGRITDSSGAVVPGAQVTARQTQTNVTASAVTDQEGRFRVRNLPAGSYNIVAVDYIEAGAWGDPELLDRLKSHAKRITLSDGGSEKVDLKLVEQY